MDFLKEVSLEIDNALAQTVKIRNKAVTELYAEILKKTPVGFDDPADQMTYWGRLAEQGYSAGTLIANWNVSLNASDESFDKDKKDNEAADTTRFAGNKIIRSALRGDSIHITNATPYASKIEHEGYSIQDGKGDMITNTEFLLDGIIAKLEIEYAASKAKRSLSRIL